MNNSSLTLLRLPTRTKFGPHTTRKYVSSPDSSASLDKKLKVNRYFPEKADNPDNAWAYRFHLAHKSPTSDLLKGKTLCIKDNICVAGVPCLVGTETFINWTPKIDATIVTRILSAG